MSKPKIKIIAHCKDGKENSLLYKENADLNPIFIENNRTPIALAYNKQLDQAKEDGTDILVFCHDDIKIYSDVIQQVEHWSKTFDVFGVSGSSCIEIKKPVSWLTMGGYAKESGKSAVPCLHGHVSHGNPDWQHVDSYGPFPSPALVIDGLFMGLSRAAIETIRFDETCPSPYDFYDLDFCLQAITNQLTVGVTDIRILHESTGHYDIPIYETGEDWFIDKWAPIFNTSP